MIVFANFLVFFLCFLLPKNTVFGSKNVSMNHSKILLHESLIFSGSTVCILNSKLAVNDRVSKLIKMIENGGGSVHLRKSKCDWDVDLIIFFKDLVEYPSNLSGKELFESIKEMSEYPSTVLEKVLIISDNWIRSPLRIQFNLHSIISGFEYILNTKGRWKYRPVSGFLNTYYGASVAINNYIYYFGGINKINSQIEKTLKIYSIYKDTPKLIKSINLPQTFGLIKQKIESDNKNYIYLTGGFQTLENMKNMLVTNSLVMFDLQKNIFFDLPKLPVVGYMNEFSFTLLNEKLHYIGKTENLYTKKNSFHYSLDISQFIVMNELNKLKWNFNREPPFSLTSHTAISLFDENNEKCLFIIGGRDFKSKSLSHAIYKYSAVLDFWIKFTSLPYTGSNFQFSKVKNETAVLLFLGEEIEENTYTKNLILFYPLVNETKIIGSLSNHLFYHNKSIQSNGKNNIKRSFEIVQRYPVNSKSLENSLDITHWLWIIMVDNNVISKDVTSTVVSVLGDVVYRDLILYNFGSSGFYKTVNDPKRVNLKSRQPIYLVPLIDGGISNLKLNIVGAAEIAFRYNFILVLPNVPTDWMTTRKKDFEKEKKIKLQIDKCNDGGGKKCVRFQEMFDFFEFLRVCEKLGIRVIHNSFSNKILNFPVSYLERNNKNLKFSKNETKVSNILMHFPLQDFCHQGCKMMTFTKSEYPDILKSYEYESSMVLLGPDPYFQIFYKKIADMQRRNLLLSALKPSKKISNLIDKIYVKLPVQYNALHLRIEEDVKKVCSTRADFKHDENCFLNINEVILYLENVFEKNSTIYLAAGDGKEKNNAITELSKYYIVLTKDMILPNINEVFDNQREILGLIDQEICLKSQNFVGSKVSSYSFLIALIRGMKREKWSYYNPKFLGKAIHAYDFVRKEENNLLKILQKSNKEFADL